MAGVRIVIPAHHTEILSCDWCKYNEVQYGSLQGTLLNANCAVVCLVDVDLGAVSDR